MSSNTCNFSFHFCGLLYEAVSTSDSKDSVACRIICELRLGKDLEGSDGGIIEAISQHLLKGVKKTAKNPQWIWSELRPRFEPGTFQTHV